LKRRRTATLPIAPRLDAPTGTLLEECLRCVLVEKGASAVVTIDGKGRVSFLNPVAEEMLGVSSERALGEEAASFLAGGFHEGRRLLKRLAKEGVLRGVQTRILRPDGAELEADLSVAMLRGGRGELTGFLALCSDRSQEARLQDELRAREQRLADIMETTADAVVVIDQEGCIASWNKGAEETYGYTASETKGRVAADLFCPMVGCEERPALERRLLAGEYVRSWETIHMRKEGRQIRVLVTLSPIHDGSGRRVGTSAVIKDITELKQLEEDLIASERLAAVGELAASIAHEVKNPLAAIRGAVEILGDGFSAGDAKVEVVGEVLGQIDRLDRMVKDLLSFARPNPPDKHPTRIHDLMESALELLREEPLRKGVSVYLNLDPELPLVPVDRRQMEQAFLNIILNGFQAMGGDGTLTVTTRLEREDVAVQFHDTGPGVPEEKLDRILQPFFTSKHKGTGLGLSIVLKVVQAHGGRLEVANHPDGGAVFTLRLPMEKSSDKGAWDASEAESRPDPLAAHPEGGRA
jgi:two-component system sporulation sensor kinase A